jgi:hypothetical protein
VTGQTAASGAFPETASPPPRIPEPGNASQLMPATPSLIPIAPTALLPTSKHSTPQRQKGRERANQPPPKVLRLKTKPILYFHRLTTNFNLTMLRLNCPWAIPRRLLAAPDSHLTSNRLTSDNVVPATRRVLASRLQVGHAGMSLPHHAFRRSDPSLRPTIEDNHENLHHRCDP